MFYRQGLDYLHSREKEIFDKHAVRIIRPFAWAAQLAVLTSPDSEGIIKQIRVGMEEKEFEVYKLRTLRPSDNITPVNVMADFLRRSGMDELIQYRNILEGNMTMVGAYRPHLTDEYMTLFDGVEGKKVDRFRNEVVGLTLPAIATDFANQTHLGLIAGSEMNPARVDLGLEYIDRCSYAYDVKIFKDIVANSLLGKMKRGDLRPAPTLELDEF